MAGRQGSSAVPAGTEALKSYSETMPGSVVKIEMVAIPAGKLAAGGKTVSVKPFWIANTETPWEAYDTFIASGTPSKAYDQTEFAADAIARPSKSYILPDLGWGHHGYPVINVSSLSVTMFCRWLSAQTGKKYRLPTDTEWEYACRAGSTASKPMTPAQANKVAWYAANSDRKTHPVAKKLPNAWKLYDMEGNAGEWANDAEGKPVLCGGVFKDNPDRLLPTMRRRFKPSWQATDPQLPKSRWWLADGNFVGFRIVCEP
jgi:formylglycine-generating enzyme required for sulfatase activity